MTPDRSPSRRRPFPGSEPADPESSWDDARIERLIAGHQAAIEARLDEGLRAIQQSGITLMHEVAAEMWRSAGGDPDTTRSHIIADLSRDQAIRGLIAHSDERFQALAVRTSRLEDGLADIAESTRGLKDVLARAAGSLQDVAAASAREGTSEVRDLIAQVQQQLNGTFERLDERDRSVTSALKQQIQEHGEVVARETSQVVQALEGYVQGGVDVMGQLAQKVEQRVEQVGSVEGDLTERMMNEVGGQLELMLERIGLESRELAETLHALQAPQEGVGDAVVHVVEARARGLAELVRSDSEVLRRQIVEAAAAQDEAVARAIDERLARISEAIGAAARFTVEETTRRVEAHAGQVIRGTLEEMGSTVEGNVQRLSDALQAELGRATDSMGERATEAIDRASGALDAAIGERLDGTLAALTTAKQTLEEVGAAAQRVATAADAVEDAAGRAGGATEQAVGRALDPRIGALAKMIRSDNGVLAGRLTELAEQEASKQALRAVKEMQASLPAHMVDELDRRFAAFAERLHRESMATVDAMARSNEALGRQIEDVGSRIGERYDEDMQRVIGSLGSAMQTLASVGRGHSPERIELD